MAFLVQEKSELGVSAVAKLKEHHIMCAEELARNQSVRKIASTFDVDESTSRPGPAPRRRWTGCKSRCTSIPSAG
jgi:hypothetical protein